MCIEIRKVHNAGNSGIDKTKKGPRSICYQIVNGLIALDFVDFSTADTNHRTTGNGIKLKIPKLSHVSSRAHFSL